MEPVKGASYGVEIQDVIDDVVVVDINNDVVTVMFPDGETAGLHRTCFRKYCREMKTKKN